MIDGAKLGILVLLAVTFAVQGGFVGFFLYLRKRAKRIADVELDTEWSELQRSVENIMTDWLGLPPLAAAHGGQIDSLIGWIHVFMLILFVGLGRVLPLLPRPFPAIAESGGGLHGGQVARLELSRDRRGRRRSGSPVRILDPAVGREGRSPAPGERSAGRAGHRRAVRLEHPLSPAPTASSAAPTSSCSTSSRTRWDSIAPILPRRTTSRRSISSICR